MNKLLDKKQLDIADRSWLAKNGRPLIISGPCSAETEEQLISTAVSLANIGSIDVLRAGIWKPRTRPNAFEGVGETGLKWLKQAGKETGLPVCTEVANARHTEQALKYGVDMLWIGARTTVNPFSVQEVADVLKGVDVPVMVKNPLNPDLELWIGALERINQAGITRLAAIHRGFSSFEKTLYRNVPRWEFPIELKRRFPDLPVICDPSHIAGSRELIGMISQKALDLEMDGLMIESHISPDSAWSDAKQQVTPTALKRLLSELVMRNKTAENPSFSNRLEELRCQIDEIDEEILQGLDKRMKMVHEIGKYKRDNRVTILQVERWDAIVKQRKRVASALDLSEEFTDHLLRILHKESIKIQTKVMNLSPVGV
ncbi:bifunctional 3-deoxy-7-phosphoheptulonate synthase/chorismate mutase type II [Fulvivirga kasyanovii]|uniref:chorismate mutase n=1 Tax=Fulvivirga kasyanovii TaxID=396812 RepID=A0ABW9RVD4_9BACT|nr:chorismate mutase [Fulvivirga kasyanovii]MTI27657.1 3-deoxy-7-phosphoheptulonate synthase [Fulvivirga kasyanovii]